MRPHPSFRLGAAAILGRERDRMVEVLQPMFSSIEHLLACHAPAVAAPWRCTCDALVDRLRRLDMADPASRAELLAAPDILLRTASALAGEAASL